MTRLLPLGYICYSELKQHISMRERSPFCSWLFVFSCRFGARLCAASCCFSVTVFSLHITSSLSLYFHLCTYFPHLFVLSCLQHIHSSYSAPSPLYEKPSIKQASPDWPSIPYFFYYCLRHPWALPLWYLANPCVIYNFVWQYAICKWNLLMRIEHQVAIDYVSVILMKMLSLQSLEEDLHLSMFFVLFYRIYSGFTPNIYRSIWQIPMKFTVF